MSAVLSGADVSAWADRLQAALVDRVQIPPLTDSIPELDVAGAYAIQHHNLTRSLAAGDTLVGRKIGLISSAMRDSLGVDGPDFGFILDAMMRSDGASITVSSLCAPRVEPEIAFRLDGPLRGPGVTVADVLDVTDAVAASMEVVDSRVTGWRITLADTMADNASAAAVVLGRWIPINDAPDLDDVTASLVVNDEHVEHGCASAIFGHPAEAVALLANALADFGTGLHAGEFVISGSITAAVPMQAGDRATAELSGLGRVMVDFV